MGRSLEAKTKNASINSIPEGFRVA